MLFTFGFKHLLIIQSIASSCDIFLGLCHVAELAGNFEIDIDSWKWNCAISSQEEDMAYNLAKKY